MTFPTTTILDNFERTEDPLDNSGKWEAWDWVSATGEAYSGTYGWCCAGSGTQGAFWTPLEYHEPAVCAEWYPESGSGDYDALWVCATNGEKENGYILTVEPESGGGGGGPSLEEAVAHFAGGAIGGGGYSVKLVLYKVVEGVQTELCKSIYEDSSEEKFYFGVWIHDGECSIWVKYGASWEERAKATDSTFTNGRIGIQGKGAYKFGLLKFAVNESAEESPPTVEKPATQKTHRYETVSFKPTGTTVKEWKAEDLPAGLSINSSTGEITGNPTTIETVTVYLRVKNEVGSAETSFKWEVESEIAPTVEKPAEQKTKKAAEVKLKVKGSGVEEWKAEGLPAGLSINATTGEITGNPTTVETTTVKIKVKNETGEAETEFEWHIITKPNHQAMML
jgi:hypothetical protein